MSEAVAWLREQIQERLSSACGLAAIGSGHWVAVKNAGLDWTVHDALGGTLQAPAMADCWGEAPAQFIAGNDPQDVIARCEAELAILDEHAEGGPDELRHGHWEGHGSNERWIRDEPNDCPVCVYPGFSTSIHEEEPCKTVRLLASGYRHRPGYAEHWGEKATTS
jgi:hypothetical protein